MDSWSARCWDLLNGLECPGVVRFDRIAPTWETQAIHRHSVFTAVISVAGTTTLELGEREMLPLATGRIAVIAPWTWHAHPRPHGNGVALILGHAGALADVELRTATASWWGELPWPALAPAFESLAGPNDPLPASGRALIAALAATRPQPAPAGGPLRRMCAYVWLNRTRPITAAQVLAASGLAYANAHRLFVQRFGTTPKRYLLDCRLSLAQRLLAAGRSPGEVWLECGFSSRADLGRRMRLDQGRTPRSCRPARTISRQVKGSCRERQ